MTACRRAAVVAVTLIAASALVPVGVGAGTSDGEPSIELVSLDRSWAAPGDAVAMLLDVEGALPEHEVRVTAFRAMGERTTFDEIIEGAPPTGNLDFVTFRYDSLPFDSGGRRGFSIGLEAIDGPDDPTRLDVRETGVYPLLVELRDEDDATLSSFVLPLVVVAPNADGSPVVGEPLRVAWVWPMVTAPAIEPDGSTDPAVVEDLQPDGRLGRQADALAEADVPLTIAPGPETLDAWTNLGETDPAVSRGVTALQTALAKPANQVLAGPYVPINVPSLLAAGLGSEVSSELVQGADTLASRLGTSVDPRTALPGPLDGAALFSLVGAARGPMIIDGSQLVPVDSQYTPAQPFMLSSQGRSAAAVATDSGIDAILVSDAPGALRAQQVLAALAVVALEQPNTPRGITIVNPNDWDAPPALIDGALAGLQSHPLLDPVTAVELFDEVPMDADDELPVDRELEPYSPPEPPVSAESVFEARRQLNAFGTLVTGPSVGLLRADRAVLASLSSEWQGDAGRADARSQLGVVDQTIDEVLSHLRVPVGNTVTLTARKGEIPVTFLNETNQTVRVRVRLESDKLVFPDGADRELELPPRNTTIGFTVEARASGTFPLTISVTSVDGELVIQESRVRVRSTFVSGMGVVLTVGAALFLVTWWVLHWRRSRRRPRPPAEPVAG